MTQDNSEHLPRLDEEKFEDLEILKDATDPEKQSTPGRSKTENTSTFISHQSYLGDSQTSNLAWPLNLDYQSKSTAKVTNDSWQISPSSVINIPPKKRKKITREYLVPSQANFTKQANNLVISLIVIILFSSSISIVFYSIQNTFKFSIHPMAIPYIDTVEKCDAIGETWEEQECLDYEDGEHY